MQRFPLAQAIEEENFIDDNGIITCPDGLAIDLATYLIRRHCGEIRAQKVLKYLREGENLLKYQYTSSHPPHIYQENMVEKAIAFMRENINIMHAHLVFAIKYRREVFTKAILDDMRDIFASVCRDFEAELVEFDGEDDHVHLLVNYPPKVAISALVDSLKGVSSPACCAKKSPQHPQKTMGQRLVVPVLLRR